MRRRRVDLEGLRRGLAWQARKVTCSICRKKTHDRRSCPVPARMRAVNLARWYQVSGPQ